MSDDQSLTLDEGAALLSPDPQPGEHSEQPDDQDSEHAQADKPEPEDNEDGDEAEKSEDPQEEEPEEDDRPEWDKDDDEDDESDKTEDGGRYASHKAKVKLPDGSEVKVAELIEGNLRHQDYTRKAQEVAQIRQHTERQYAELQQLNQQLEQQQHLILTAASQMLPVPPTAHDWQEDPVGAGQRKAQYDEAIQYLQNLQGQMAGYQQQMTAQQQQAHWQAHQERQRNELNTLYQAMPQLRDAKKAQAFAADVSSGLTQYYGFQPDELGAIVDHRNILVAADALRYRRLMANRSEAQKKGTAKSPKSAPITRSGKRLSGTEARAQSVSRVEEKLGKARSLDMDQAVELLMARKRR